jgi:hypothetical protein
MYLFSSGPGRGYQVAAAGVSLVGFRKDLPQKILKNIGLGDTLKPIEKHTPYSSYAPTGGRSPARRKSAAPEPEERADHRGRCCFLASMNERRTAFMRVR